MPFLYYISSACESARLHGHVIASKKHFDVYTKFTEKTFLILSKIHVIFCPTTWRPTPPPRRTLAQYFFFIFPQSWDGDFLLLVSKSTKVCTSAWAESKFHLSPFFSRFYRRRKHNTESQHEFMIKYDFIKKFAFKIYSLDNDLPEFMFFSSLPCILPPPCTVEYMMTDNNAGYSTVNTSMANRIQSSRYV